MTTEGEPKSLPLDDHDDYVRALEVLAEVSEPVVEELRQKVLDATEQATFQPVAQTEWARSERRFNLGMGKLVGGVALGTAGFATEAIAMNTDHKGVIVGGALAIGMGALALFKGGKQAVDEIGWAHMRAEQQREFSPPDYP